MQLLAASSSQFLTSSLLRPEIPPGGRSFATRRREKCDRPFGSIECASTRISHQFAATTGEPLRRPRFRVKGS